MRIVVVYDRDGNIVNVARVRALSEGISHPFGDLAEEHRVLSIEEPGEDLREASLLDIQQQSRVDIETEKLVPKDQ